MVFTSETSKGNDLPFLFCLLQSFELQVFPISHSLSISKLIHRLNENESHRLESEADSWQFFQLLYKRGQDNIPHNRRIVFLPADKIELKIG
jgi:hypothetical protein